LLLLGWEDRLGRVELLRFFALCEADNAACDPGAMTFTEATLTIVSLLVLGLVEVVLSLIENH